MINRRAPEVTFTPTAAGLHDGEGHGADPALDLQTMVSEAISRIFLVGIQQAACSSSTTVKPLVPVPISAVSESPSVQESIHSEGSLQDKDYFEEFNLSDDKGMAPDMPAFPGLFRPSLFKSI